LGNANTNVKPTTPLIKQFLQTNKTIMVQQNCSPMPRSMCGNAYEWDDNRVYEDELRHFDGDNGNQTEDESFGIDPYNHFT
jgi:hypothetical protein